MSNSIRNANADQAADEVLALINSRPRTPSREEIAAIIARVIPPQQGIVLSQEGHVQLAHWDAILTKHLADIHNTEDDAPLCAETEAVWARPARSWDDVALLAAIAVHWNVDDERLPFPDYQLEQMAHCKSERMDERAVAFLMRSILDLFGLKFDADGRRIR